MDKNADILCETLAALKVDGTPVFVEDLSTDSAGEEIGTAGVAVYGKPKRDPAGFPCYMLEERGEKPTGGSEGSTLVNFRQEYTGLLCTPRKAGPDYSTETYRRALAALMQKGFYPVSASQSPTVFEKGDRECWGVRFAVSINDTVSFN